MLCTIDLGVFYGILFMNCFGFDDEEQKKIRLSPFKLFCFFTLLTSLSLENFAFARAPKNQQVWVISQSSSLAGNVSSELADNALRMRIGKLGLTIITKAPKWNALVFNENSKTYVDLPYKNWQNKFILDSKSVNKNSGGKFALTSYYTGKTMKIAKFQTSECLVVKKVDSSKKIAAEKVSQLWIASSIKAPPQIAQIFCSHLTIPIQKGIPLRANRYVNGKAVAALDTQFVERRMVSASMFEPLSGYKKVKDEMELVMGESSSQAMEDLLDLPKSPEKKR
jgi:hypothetical protein